MRFKIPFRILLLVACVLVAQVSLVSAQGEVSPQKRIAIRKVIEGFELPRHTSSMFEELMTLYQENWTVTVIADLKAKGLFKGYTPKQVSALERVIGEFSREMYGEIRTRMRAEVFTLESVESMALPSFNKYLTEGEIAALVDFIESAGSRKLVDAYYRVLTEAMVLQMKQSGVFDVKRSADAEEAKFDKLKNDLEINPAPNINEIISIAVRLARDQFSESEMQEWSSMANNPLWVKLAQVAPNMAAEIGANSTRLYGPLVAKITQEVIDENLKLLEGRLKSALAT